MVSRQQWESAEAIEALEEHFSRRRLLHVHTEILVHAFAEPDAPPCPCCASTSAKIVQRIDDLSMIVDRITGERIERWRLAPEDLQAYDDLCAIAEDCYLPLRATPEQLPLLLSTATISLGGGGSRSGKTSTAIAWLLRRWLLRGGRGKRMLYLAPALDIAFDLVTKLIYGTGPTPPLLPPRADGSPSPLLVSWPESADQRRLALTMCDGTVILLKHLADKSGKALKGKAFVDALLDEGTEMKTLDQWSLLVNRLADYKGAQLMISTTPRPSHFLRELVVEKAQRGEPGFFECSLSMRQNPWFDLPYIERLIAAQPTSGAVSREVDGKWVSDSGFLWQHWRPEYVFERLLTANGGRDLVDYGLGDFDVTERWIRAFAGLRNPYHPDARVSNFRYAGSGDLNVSPMSTLVWQLAARTDCIFCGAKVMRRDGAKLKCASCGKSYDPLDPKFREHLTIHVFDEVQTGTKGTRTNSVHHCERLNSVELAKVVDKRNSESPYKGMLLVLDKSAWDGADKTMGRGIQRIRGAIDSAAQIYASHGFDPRPPMQSPTEHQRPWNPSVRQSVSQVHTLMRAGRIRVHERCTVLLRAIKTQESNPDGLPLKESGTASDRNSSTIDALRYACWAVYSGTNLEHGNGMSRVTGLFR